MTDLETPPQEVSKSEKFWRTIREQLKVRPKELIHVTTYNHPTLAYRAKRDIKAGLNPVFPENGQWDCTVVRDEASMFYGPRSHKPTWKHELWMIHTPGE